MATRDEKGYIRYSPEELERIPSFEERSDGRMAGLTGGTLGLLAGGTIGAAGGPGTALAGMVGGAVIGNQAGRAVGAGAGAGAGAGNQAARAMEAGPRRPAASPLEDLSQELREDPNPLL